MSLSVIITKRHPFFCCVLRRKTRKELVRISAAVMGIEFSYAAETAFVSPTLLRIGVEHKHMTLVWALSPLIGFFLTPILGSLSDRCPLKLGRRRPFILCMSLGVLLGKTDKCIFTLIIFMVNYDPWLNGSRVLSLL